MLRNSLASRLLSVALIVSLLSVCAPVGTVAAKPVTKLEVDVWLDSGGEGPNASGGEYEIGETPTIYFTATIGCNTRLSLRGPDGSTRSFEQPAMYGPVYQLQLGVAEESDIGQWYVVLEAATSTGDQYSKDMTSFVVLGPEPEPEPEPEPSSPSTQDTPGTTPPPDTPTETPPLFTPPTLVPSEDAPESESSPGLSVDKPTVIGPRTARAVDALLARKMANGSLPADLNLDVDGDGQVTSEDARLMLGWAVDNQAFFGMVFDPERLQITGHSEDGYPTWVYNCPRQEVAHGVFLEKSIALAETSSGYGQEINLTFENENDTDVEFWHMEVIPKSFAAHVDDIHFSRQPDVIIDPDPSVGFVIAMVPLTVLSISMAVDSVATSQAIQGVGESVLGWLGGFVSQPYMTPSKFDALSPEERCSFIRNALEPHVGLIRSSARRNNIPPSLLAMVILNELIDYGVEDQVQEHISNLGSSGIAQISVRTAIEHNLVDVTEEEVENQVRIFVAAASHPEPMPQSMWPEGIRQKALEHLVWQKLNQPEYAIEAAAREIDFALNRINDNLGKTWASHFLEGPIDKNDICANIKVRSPNVTDPEKIRLMQKQAMALMVAAAYNTQTLPLTSLSMTNDPYSSSFDDAGHFANAVRHGHWAALYVETLERCLPLDEEENVRDMSPYARVTITANLVVTWTHDGVADSYARGPGGERLATDGFIAYGEGRWVSPTQFEGSWDYVEQSMMYGAFRKEGEVSITLDPNDPNHVLHFRIRTVEAPERAEPRVKTRVIDGGNVYQRPGFSKPYYSAFGEEACQAVTSISGTKNEFEDGSSSSATQFSCNADTTSGLIIEFHQPA